ncbi:MAG: RNA polymerase sigma factor [Gemmatimonadetes bacterium]|nr:RNA polymerase sigma factor [Gemmatimonadota bacterium]
MPDTHRSGELKGNAPEDRQEVFRRLFDAWHGRIYQTCYRLMGNPQEAEDITQDVFVRAMQAYDRFRGDADPGTWLYRIAVNQCLNVRRRKRRLQWLALDFWNEGADETAMLRDRSVEEDLQQADRERIVGQAIDALPERQRTALILSHFERMSYKAIAEAMDCTPSAVESLLHRAKTSLGRRLRPHLDEL